MGEEQIKTMFDKLNIMLEHDKDIAVDSVDEIVDKFNEYVEENIPHTTEEQKDISEEEIVKKFQKELLDNAKPLDPEIQELVNDNFWDLIDD